MVVVRAIGHQHPGFLFVLANDEILLSRDQDQLLPLAALVGSRKEGIVICTSRGCDTTIQRKSDNEVRPIKPALFPDNCIFPRFLNTSLSVCLRFNVEGDQLLKVDTNSGRVIDTYTISGPFIEDVGVFDERLVLVAFFDELVMVKNFQEETRVPVPGTVSWLRRVRDLQVIGIQSESSDNDFLYSVLVMRASGEVSEIWSSTEWWPFDAQPGPDGTLELSIRNDDVIRREQVRALFP